MMKILDKVIPKGYEDAITEDLSSLAFPWHYVNDVTNPNANYYKNNAGLVHLAHNVGDRLSEWMPFLKPLVYSISEAAELPMTHLYRIRVGMLLRTDSPTYTYNLPHVDFLWPHYTACYYVDNSDGDTVVFNQRIEEVGEVNDDNIQNYTSITNFTELGRASPKKGSVCLFDGAHFHSSTKPSHHDRRMVITINFY